LRRRIRIEVVDVWTMQVFVGMTRIAVAALAATVLAPLPMAGAAAYAQQPCAILCAPKLDLVLAAARTHLVDRPRVRSLTTGAESELGSKTLGEVIVAVTVPTALPRASLFASYQWFPNAERRSNPFTEYTEAEVGEDIRANVPSISMGASVAVVPASATHGWAALDARVGDLYSTAARPDDRSSYTHKLDLSVLGSVTPFAHAGGYLHGMSGVVVLDVVATGLPRRGDEVPKGSRVFLDDARAVTLTAGIAFPIAPSHR
jgi:hypothetical protein